MNRSLWTGLAIWGAMLASTTVQAEILALVNYETKPEHSFRKEGIAIIDVDPASPNFGKILADMPLPPDFHNHHIFYNRDSSKAYVTGLGRGKLYVLDLKRFPYRLHMVSVPDCAVGEDVVVSEDNTRWYLTCMGSSAVIVGDAIADKPIKTIRTPKPYPHGIAIHSGIDRILITETISHELKNPGETITAIEASTADAASCTDSSGSARQVPTATTDGSPIEVSAPMAASRTDRSRSRRIETRGSTARGSLRPPSKVAASSRIAQSSSLRAAICSATGSPTLSLPN